MFFAFNVRALNVAVLLIRRGPCLPLGVVVFKSFSSQEFEECLYIYCFTLTVQVLFNLFILSIWLPQFVIMTEENHQDEK